VYGWNFSLSFVSGNATVWAPSRTTPLTSVAVTKLIASVLEANKLPGALACLATGGKEVGAKLVQADEVDLVSFTGSESVGRSVGKEPGFRQIHFVCVADERGHDTGQTVQARFGKTLLELGGNNAAVVLPDADLDLALRTLVFGAIGTAGQRCTSTRRLYVHESVADTFLERLVKSYEQVKVGNPLDPSVLLGPLHSKAALGAYHAAISEAQLADGAQLLTGGKALAPLGQGKGSWAAPAILRHPDGGRKSATIQRETFAPVLHATTFRTLEEAIELNNSVRQGLASTLFTRCVVLLLIPGCELLIGGGGIGILAMCSSGLERKAQVCVFCT
jgi:aldehyde dehydrogenase family 7 protein A1